jgi:hypothetical protein
MGVASATPLVGFSSASGEEYKGTDSFADRTW